MVLIATLRPERVPMHPSDFTRPAEVHPLEWDSNFFRARMAAIRITGPRGSGDLRTESDALATELRAALREAELERFEHVSLRVPAEDVAAIWAAERAGLRLMDNAVDLRFDFASTPLPLATDPRIRLGTAADIPALRAMTAGAFNLTRYALDPFFSLEQVDAFYATWATNLFSGLADAVFVADVEGQPAAFVSAKLSGDGTGRIPLVATARHHQRKGLARGLLNAALEWFAHAELDVAFVKTQTANYPAVSLYERAGFHIHQSELTFTTTLNQE
jgi:ribosomal protein S18 acetylase RimI-like enzyme